MSIGELMNLYRDHELDIHPEFQRYYRWSGEQKTRFVESLLLGIPIPSIFVSQPEDGVWDVVDGLQRLSTIFQLVGILEDMDGNLVPPLVLKRTPYLPSLEGMIWGDDDTPKGLGSPIQLLVRRSKIDVKIILRESTESTKYELFQRLNTGGSVLSDQELRNVVLIMVNNDAYQWILGLAETPEFLSSIALSDRQVSEQYHLKLLIRFLAFRSLGETDLNSIGDIGDFLTNAIIEFAQSEQFEQNAAREEKAFKHTFKLLADSLDDSSFHRYDHSRGRFLGGFLISAYEAIAIGIGANYEKYASTHRTPDIEDITKLLWQNPRFTDNSGSGIRASSRIPNIIPLGRELFAT
jgi:hypothetical protein